jgi:hypothetical protein
VPNVRQLKLAKMNIAERILESYDSKDFKENYMYALAERFGDCEGDIINRIIDLFNRQHYETEQTLKNWLIIDRVNATKIYNFIVENFEEFVKDFNGFWVGPTSLESYEFGEQEEQLTGMSKPGFKGEYTLKYMQRVFDAAGYFVKGEYAYYNINKGVHVDLLANVELLDNFLLTL